MLVVTPPQPKNGTGYIIRAPGLFHSYCLWESTQGMLHSVCNEVLWWSNRFGELFQDLPEHAPVLILLPGLTGGSDNSYILHAVVKARLAGLRACVFNSRGTGGAPVTSPQFYSASFTGDTRWLNPDDFGRRAFVSIIIRFCMCCETLQYMLA